MPTAGPQPVNPAMLAALRERLPAGSAHLSLEAFIACALYHPQLGYYSTPRARVGRRPDADFYTATSIGTVFSTLVLDAIGTLCGGSPGQFAFVEIGAEPGGGLLAAAGRNPFRAARTIRTGDPLELSGPCIVFSNELFDAQPFRRFIRHGGRWTEAAVTVMADGLAWTRVEPAAPLPPLPDGAAEGYVIDWPSGAHALLEQICGADWQGLFLAFDYGLDRDTVLRLRPHGTGRTYARHRMGDDLLADPGRTDITCHLLWDELEERLARCGFSAIRLQRQEAFLMGHAAAAIAAIVQGGAPGFSRDKQSLMELLHPDNMGRKFQVLSATRPPK